MHPPGSQRTRLIVAGSLAVIVAAVVAYVISSGGSSRVLRVSPPRRTTASRPVRPPVSPPAVTPPKRARPRRRPARRFTVAFYGNGRARTRDFRAIPALEPPFRLAWKFGGNALLEFPVTIWGNNLYLLDDGATLKRVNIRTGRQIWARHLGVCSGCGLSASTPSLDVRHRELYVSVLSVTGSTTGATGGEEAAVSMRSGHILWTFPVPSGTESSPMVVGDSVYFGDQGGTFYSLNARTGHENWAFSTGGSIKGAADYYDGNLYFGNYAGQFYAVDTAGHEVWSASPGGQFYSTPAVGFGRVYVGNKNGEAYAFDAHSGGLDWSAGLGGYVYGGPAVANIRGRGPTVYIGSYDGDLYALSALTGAVDWTAAVGAISGSATVVNHTVYVSTVYSPGSYGFDARTGLRVFTFPDGSYTTVVASRHALFLMGKYVLYKFLARRVPRAPSRRRRPGRLTAQGACAGRPRRARCVGSRAPRRCRPRDNPGRLRSRGGRSGGRRRSGARRRAPGAGRCHGA
jgi:outer membrane protein assembly factor BamB